MDWFAHSFIHSLIHQVAKTGSSSTAMCQAVLSMLGVPQQDSRDAYSRGTVWWGDKQNANKKLTHELVSDRGQCLEETRMGIV